MARLHLEIFVLSALLASCCGASPDSINADLVNKNVQVTVDILTHLPKVTANIVLENTGKTSVRSFLYAVDPALKDKLTFIGAVSKSGDEDSRLVVKQTNVANHQGKVFFRVDLARPLESNKVVTVNVESTYSHALKAFPAEITQAEKQFVQFTGNSHFYSPYKTVSQGLVVNAASSSIENYSKNRPVSVSENTITYGPYSDVKEFSEKEMVVHFENNTPFLTVTHMTRLIEVSHWGNVAIEETVDIIHSGATLKGPFSRYDYQRHSDGVSAITSFKTVLPAAARDVYYRDEIGNISTSNLRELDDMVELELKPRFPLFGGWKTHYMVGYNVPSYQYIYNSGDDYVLKMRFVDHIYDDQVIDSLTIKVILPEGSSGLEFTAPFSVDRLPNERHYTYLDTIGRPVVVAHKTGLVEAHIQDFELKYSFSKYMLLQEPFLVVGAFYLLFVTVILYVRLDFSITKDEAKETRLRIAGLVENVQTIQDCRSALYQSYEDAINKFKASKDLTLFTANRKKIDGDYKQMTQQISGLASKLKAENSDSSDKVAELQKLDAKVKEQVGLEMQYAEKLVMGKMKKDQYVDTEASIKKVKEELYAKMETLLTTL